jgi:hypothetical protein
MNVQELFNLTLDGKRALLSAPDALATWKTDEVIELATQVMEELSELSLAAETRKEYDAAAGLCEEIARAWQKVLPQVPEARQERFRSLAAYWVERAAALHQRAASADERRAREQADKTWAPGRSTLRAPEPAGSRGGALPRTRPPAERGQGDSLVHRPEEKPEKPPAPEKPARRPQADWLQERAKKGGKSSIVRKPR